MLVSIIVPVYNVKKYLERCLNSILKQSFTDYEVILVDDGSRDGSSEICNRYADKYDNFHVIHKENAGLGFARNTGLDYARGKYVMFVDSDDYIEPTMIENLYSCLILNNADTCIGGFRRIQNDKIDIKENSFAGQVFSGEQIQRELLIRMLGKKPNGKDNIEMSVWKVLFSNEIIKKYQLRFPSEREMISEDIIFNLDYYALSKIVCISKDTGYCYCDNEGSLTTKYREDRFLLQKKLYLHLIEKTQKMDLYELCKDRISTTFLSNVRYCIKLEVKFQKKIGKKQMIKNIKTICNDQIVQQVFSEYSMGKVPIKSRLINNFIKYKLIRILVLIMKFKNKFNV